MTGVADPYEPPLSPELRLETVNRSVEQNAAAAVDYLEDRGLL
jgi:bifunctional enzyme CysN/CysC